MLSSQFQLISSPPKVLLPTYKYQIRSEQFKPPQKRPLFTWFPRHLLCLFHPTQTLVAAHSLMLPRSAAVQLMLTSNGVEAELSPFLRLAHSRCRSTYPVVEKQNSETAVSPLSQDPPRWRSSSRKNRRSAAALPEKNGLSSLVAECFFQLGGSGVCFFSAW